MLSDLPVRGRDAGGVQRSMGFGEPFVALRGVGVCAWLKERNGQLFGTGLRVRFPIGPGPRLDAAWMARVKSRRETGAGLNARTARGGSALAGAGLNARTGWCGSAEAGAGLRARTACGYHFLIARSLASVSRHLKSLRHFNLRGKPVNT